MTGSGDAAEQVVRLSLEGIEAAAKLTGTAAKELALILASVLKQEIEQSGKTRGKARLTSMIKSGKELKAFSIPQKDLKKFTEQAKRYGVLYCVLREKNNKAADAPVDIIARADDVSKIQRIVERFEIGKVDKGAITHDTQNEADREKTENPTPARTVKSPPFERQSEQRDIHTDKGTDDKPSVREKLERYKSAAAQKEAEHSKIEPEKDKPKMEIAQTVHRQPKARKRKSKER